MKYFQDTVKPSTIQSPSSTSLSTNGKDSCSTNSTELSVLDLHTMSISSSLASEFNVQPKPRIRINMNPFAANGTTVKHHVKKLPMDHTECEIHELKRNQKKNLIRQCVQCGDKMGVISKKVEINQEPFVISFCGDKCQEMYTVNHSIYGKNAISKFFKRINMASKSDSILVALQNMSEGSIFWNLLTYALKHYEYVSPVQALRGDIYVKSIDTQNSEQTIIQREKITNIGKQYYTLLLPTNDAFHHYMSHMKIDSIDSIMKDRDFLKKIIARHVIPALVIPHKDKKGVMVVHKYHNWLGEVIHVRYNAPYRKYEVYLNESKIIEMNKDGVIAKNGIIYFINDVLHTMK